MIDGRRSLVEQGTNANRPTRKAVLSWAFYDWANSAFATTVIAGFFPVFFKQYWNSGVEVTVSTFRLGLANSVASLVIVVLAPVIGAIADQGGIRKRLLIAFAFIGIVMTGALYLVHQGAWAVAASLYVFASIGFLGGNVFYDSLIIDVAREPEFDRVSAYGYALGYLGGGLLFAVNVVMTLRPQWFGLADAAHAVRISFLMVAAWWAIFSIPLLLFVKERTRPNTLHSLGTVRAGLVQLRATFKEVRDLRTVMLFLAGYWLYIDGVDTIIRMAVDYGLSLGFDPNSLIVALLVTQFVGFPAAIVFGRLGERIGTKQAIFIAIAIYCAVTFWGAFLENVNEFYVLAIAIGLVQGGVQSLSRSLYARLIPTEKSAEFFGFYNMLGKSAAVIGPLLMGGVALLSGSSRVAIFSIIVLFIGGAFFLSKVDVEEAKGRIALGRA